MSSWRGANTALSTTVSGHDGAITTTSTSNRGNSGNTLSKRRRTSNTDDDALNPPLPISHHHHHGDHPRASILPLPPPNSRGSDNVERQEEEEEETVEAVLNRLMKSYTMAMECINTFHKLDTVSNTNQTSTTTSITTITTNTTTNNNNNDNTSLLPMDVDDEDGTNNNNKEEEEMKKRQSSLLLLLFRVGRAARDTLEHSILRNPLVRQHTYHNNNNNNNNTSRTILSLPLSPSHSSTVRQIAYLSYINYADLLLMGMSSSSSTSILPSTTTATPTTTTRTVQVVHILDRGVVKSSRTLSNIHIPNGTMMTTPSSCWVSSTIRTENVDTTAMESHETTVRLAMTAYMDALSMDASDPTVYIKLACATRRLNRILLLSSSSSLSNHVPIKYAPYRKLERYALECAMTALPMHRVPVNRTAQQALQEWWCEEEEEEEEEEDGNETYNTNEIPGRTTSSLFPIPSQHLTMALPRYSWSTFARLLLRACKDGTLSHSSPSDASSSFLVPFMSPNIHLQLSPLIALPTTLLSKVVSFLSPKQLWPLEATCRAISASMVSVRVLIHKDSGDNMKTDRRDSVPLGNVVTEEMEDPMPEMTTVDEAPSILSTVSHQPATTEAVSDATVEPIKRKSSRVQSQMITSSKRTERQNRRNSVEFCFLASTLGCSTTDDPIYERMKQSYDHHVQQQSNNTTVVVDPRQAAVSVTDCMNVPNLVTTPTKSQSSLNQYYWNESSLYSFIHESISKLNHPSPLTCMFHFVAHASIYASKVFGTTSDRTSVLDMQSHLLESTFGRSFLLFRNKPFTHTPLLLYLMTKA